MTRGVFFEKWGPNEEHHWEPFSRDLEQIVKAAQAEQRRKLIEPHFVEWCKRVLGHGLSWNEIGAAVKTYLEEADALEAQEE